MLICKRVAVMMHPVHLADWEPDNFLTLFTGSSLQQAAFPPFLLFFMARRWRVLWRV